jgi:conjugal transfer pilus assembly protein TraF
MRSPFMTLHALALLLAGTLSAAPVPEKQGYWWKREAPPVEEADPKHPELPPPPAEAALLAMHPTEVTTLIEDYRQYALWKLTPEHVTWYYGLQDFARRRSRAFMAVTDMVMLQNPSLNMNAVYPTTTAGQDVRTAQRQASFDARLAAERNGAALVLLTQRDCPYCTAQRMALRYFVDRHGWEVREIDVDREPAIATRFGSQVTPTTLVIFKGSDAWFPVAVGVESVPRLEEAVYRAIRRLHGETTPEQFLLQEFQQDGPLDPQRSTERPR